MFDIMAYYRESNTFPLFPEINLSLSFLLKEMTEIEKTKNGFQMILW